MFHFFPIQEAECIYWQGLAGLCTKNTSSALIERPYSCAPQAVGAVYDRPGFFVQSREEGNFLPLLTGPLSSPVLRLFPPGTRRQIPTATFLRNPALCGRQGSLRLHQRRVQRQSGLLPERVFPAGSARFQSMEILPRPFRLPP